MSEIISIIVPVYNSEKYLDKCLQSILNQTYNNIEIIIVNDNSKDKSRDIILSYMKKYKNILFLDNNKNLGVSISRNKALDIASGKYISFIDSDDWIEPNMIETMYIEAENGDFDVVICDVLFRYNDGRKEEFRINLNDNKILSKEESIKELLTHKNNLQGYSCNKLYKREILLKNNIRYPSNIKLYEDIIFNLDVFINSNKVKYINQYLYNYYQGNESATRSFKVNKKSMEDIFDLIDLARNTITNRLNFSDYKEEFYSFANRILISEIIKVTNSNITLNCKEEIINSVLSKEINRLYISKVKYKNIGKLYRNTYILSKLLKIIRFNTKEYIYIYLSLRKIKNIIIFKEKKNIKEQLCQK